VDKYEKHLETITKRNAIVEYLLSEWEPTHTTTKPTWHGYQRPANTPLIASPELGELFGRYEVRDACGCYASWYADLNGDVVNLWACQVEEVTE